ncbi:isoliquiritigenin 2'-O-methyltransferase-like [Gastrolobium bilobum]|uniref:isoliquiritigenin 2'-O-methyltransferase-like n=1 Tax=Gastrolobium bilobum TaxID=150636 RepID=UPI002AB0AF4D|nr:isoliquiritigenin 2'-O-methyltransferase-like [Gastrolobium bilobum]
MSSNSKLNPLSTEVAKDEAYRYALLLSTIRVFPAFLNAAVDLNLFEIIAKSSSYGSNMSASEIASHMPNQHPELANRLERMLPLLASYSLLTCSIRTNEDGKNERVYSLSHVGEYFAYDKVGGSTAPLSTLLHRGFDAMWMNVKDAFEDADSNIYAEKVFGMPLYKHIETDKELSDIFMKAMAHVTPLEMKIILEIYKGFDGVSTLVDVGGGIGQALKGIISDYPSIKGINFDLPHVVQNAPPHQGIEHIGGDMFECVPEGDAIMLKEVCHNWSDEKCVKLLKNCYKALPQHGKVIILDCIMPETPNSSTASKHACIADSLMFLTHGGKERTEKELENLCRSSGFSRFHVACNDFSAMSGVIEFYK